MSKKYLFREYWITEYEIEADSREDAEEKLYGKECIQLNEWLDKTTLRPANTGGVK